MELKSIAFSDGQEIPEDYTCHGKNVSPPLEWTHLPPQTAEIAMVCQDPDATQSPPFIHWIIFGVPPHVMGLTEGIGNQENPSFPQGVNSAGNTFYTGPNPPPGTGAHRYYFRLFALDSALPMQPGISIHEFYEAIRDHILAEAELVGKHRYH